MAVKKQRNHRMLGYAVLIAGSLALGSCGSKDDSDETTETSSTTDGTDDVSSVNALATAYPGDLALSVFPDSETSLRLQDDAASQDAAIDKPYEEKIEEAENRLKGEGDCFDPSLMGEHKSETQVTCYDFDADMNPTTSSSNGNTYTVGTEDGTDGNGQACMVTFAKAEVSSIVFKVDKTLAMVQGLLCSAKKAAVAAGSELVLPTVGDEAGLDMLTAVNSEMPSGRGITMSAAVMSAFENSDGSTGYMTEMTFTNSEGSTDVISLRHVPPTTEGGDESGVLTFMRSPNGTDNGDQNQQWNKYDVMSINYIRTTATDGTEQMQAELRSAMINKSYEPIDSDGLVAYGNVPDAAQNSDIHAIKYVSFDLNPANGAGTLSYWMNPGGNITEAARGFLFNIAADDSGVLSGCGVSGAAWGVSIRASLADSTGATVLEPTKFWHPLPGTNTHANPDTRYVDEDGNSGNLITKQCFSQNASGVYAIDTAETTHARGYDVLVGTAAGVEPPSRPEMPPPPPAGTGPTKPPAS